MAMSGSTDALPSPDTQIPAWLPPPPATALIIMALTAPAPAAAPTDSRSSRSVTQATDAAISAASAAKIAIIFMSASSPVIRARVGETRLVG